MAYLEELESILHWLVNDAIPDPSVQLLNPNRAIWTDSDACYYTRVGLKRRNIMPLITDSEMEDLDAAILGAGFEVDDFSVVDWNTSRQQMSSTR